MKRVGVITFSRTTHNYGQILQCYAMQQTLKKNGCSSFLIQYNHNTKGSYKYLTVKSKVLKILGAISYYMKKSLSQEVVLDPTQQEPDRHFKDFIKEHISTIYYKTIDDLYLNPPVADAIICGSDQIWGTGTPLFYLDFIKDKRTKKIAYAPSFGGGKFNIIDIVKLRLMLKDFDHISVREEDGIKICKKGGRSDVSVVPDPTLLLSMNEYKKISSARLVPSKKYIFVYMLKNDTDFNLDTLMNEAKKRDLSIVYVTANGLTDNYPKVYPSIEEWLGLIENATYVVTNSFHGSVFSILFNKNFKVYPLIGVFSQMNLRIETLLKNYNIQQCESVFDVNIDYSDINKKLKDDSEIYQRMLYSWIID